jgi:hypothetical protein
MPPESELIELREKWADLPIINFWHDTNDAPDEFFDALLAGSRGEVSEEETGSRTTVRTKATKEEKDKATSSYVGAMAKGAKVSKQPTKKGWGKFWKYVNPKGATKLSDGRSGSIPPTADRKAGVECENMVVTKGLDLSIGYGRGARGTTAFEKGPVRGTSEYMKIDRKCNNCGNNWSINADFKDKDVKCPKCRKEKDFKDTKGPYKQSGEVLLIPVGMFGDGQTVAFILLTGAEAKKMSFLKPGDRVCVRGWVKGQGYDASVASGLGLSGSGLKHYGYTFKKGGPTQAVPLITLGSKSHGGYIKKV